MDVSEEDNSIEFKGSAPLEITIIRKGLSTRSMTPRDDEPAEYVKPKIPKLLLAKILTPLTDNEKVLSGDDAGENSENSNS